MNFLLPSAIEKIEIPLLKEKGIDFFIKRDDLIHPIISGNKWRKLKYNISKAKELNQKTILTFGGAYSNHIVATAFACWENGLKSIGVIRGEELDTLRVSSLQTPPAFGHLPLERGGVGVGTGKINQTLLAAAEYGMQLHFVSREEYKRKDEKNFMEELKNKFGDFYLIPEGGANYEGILGCKEILPEVNDTFNYICCAGGTGTTLTGLLLSLRENESLIGFPALKGGEFIRDEVEKNIQNYFPSEKEKIKSLQLNCDYHFGGYAKVNDELKNFVSDFFDQTNIQLDLIYNGKMMYGLLDLIKKDHFPKNTRILAIHTGGTQGNKGFL